MPDHFLVHSCHCYFLLAGSADVPILFHVERVRDGRSFATRTVQARQRGRCIFTTTISFVRDGAGGALQVRHAAPLPADAATAAPVAAPPDDWDDEPPWERAGPFQSMHLPMLRAPDAAARPDELRARHWLRSRRPLSPAGGHQAHLNALAYMSDHYFIATVGRIHRLWRFPFAAADTAALPDELRARVAAECEYEGLGPGPDAWAALPRLGMLVSLDHSIYFHEPLRVRVDDWLFSDMESPWSGSGRGVVMQRIFAKDGTLLATCVQEVRWLPASSPLPRAARARALTPAAGRRAPAPGRRRAACQAVAAGTGGAPLCLHCGTAPPPAATETIDRLNSIIVRLPFLPSAWRSSFSRLYTATCSSPPVALSGAPLLPETWSGVRLNRNVFRLYTARCSEPFVPQPHAAI